MIRVFAIILAFGLISALPAGAGPIEYNLDQDRSQVGFRVMFGPDPIKGTIPIQKAEVILDFQHHARSEIRVTLDATRAKAGFPFATQAMTGPKVLAVAQYPTIRFESRNLVIGNSSAKLDGDLTIRGVTRPVVLDAQVFRQAGTEAGDRSRMSVHLAGTINRSAFGAVGWSDRVADEIALNILVRIDRRAANGG